MPDFFRDFLPREIADLGRDLLAKSRNKMPKHFEPSAKMTEGYQFLSGEIEDTSKLFYKTYCNELYDAWKGWAPKFCSRPPKYMVRPASETDRAVAKASEELFAYRTQRFDYQRMILECCQDAVILGVGYARHHFDESRGLTVTSRFKPQNVFWDATAKTTASASHVIEKHTLPRWQFVKKFGQIGWEINAAECEDAPSYFPDGAHWLRDGKSPLDPIEYYLLWVNYDGFRRCYAFHNEWHEDYLDPASREAGKCVGEEWKFDLDEGEWHITPLIPTILNDRIEGIAVWEVVRGQYLMYQNVMGAVTKYALETCKNPILAPDTLLHQMKQIEKSGETTFTVSYPKHLLDEFGGRKIGDLIERLPMGEVKKDLVDLMLNLQQRFQQLAGVTAVSQIQPGGVETAAEATKLADAANNRVADDQGAVERWTNKIGRKEQTIDFQRIPKLSVVKWRMPEDVKADEDPENYGKTAGTKKKAQYIRNVPYLDAIRLEKGPASDKAALKMEARREEERNKAVMGQMMGDPDMMGMAPEEAEQAVPVTPEVEVRRKYGVPVLAEVEICNPGVEQFIPAENAEYWPERSMTRREVERMFSVAIEQGTATATGRMQQIQEIGMVAKTVMPSFEALGLSKQQATMLNVIVRSLQRDDLEGCEVTAEEIDQKKAEAAQAAQEAAVAEAQAKQPQGDNPEVVRMQSEAEMAKAQASVLTSREKTVQIDKKNEGDAARDRSKNQAMLLQSQLNASTMNGVGA